MKLKAVMTKKFKLWGPVGLLSVLLVAPLNAVAGELAGTLEWGKSLSIGTLVNGRVATVAVKEGQVVSKGDLLIALDRGVARARVSEARALKAYADILLEEAQREDDRATELYDRTVLSEHERVKTTIALRQAQAEAKGATARLAEARQDLEYREMRAPFDGRVISLKAVPGMAVVNAESVTSLMTLADSKMMRLVGGANAAAAAELAQAASLQVQLAGQQVAAQLQQIERRGTAGEMRWTVKFAVPAGVTLRAGESARLLW